MITLLSLNIPLNHLAREWYHSLDLDQFRGDWSWFTTHFSRYFSTQGRNIKHLHERWRTFSFDPANDDIEEYIRDVKEAAKQLGHGDDAVVNLLKSYHAHRIVWNSIWPQ